MKRVLIAYWSRTGRTERMAEYIAEGIRSSGNEVEVRRITEIKSEKELKGYDGYLFGCPTYFRDMIDKMKTFLFLAEKADLGGKPGGAFGSYTHFGNAPKILSDTMEHVFQMNMGTLGPLNVKEQILDAGKGEESCREYGRSMGETIGMGTG
jgi:flavodoxin